VSAYVNASQLLVVHASADAMNASAGDFDLTACDTTNGQLSSLVGICCSLSAGSVVLTVEMAAGFDQLSHNWWLEGPMIRTVCENDCIPLVKRVGLQTCPQMET
jgi:hypothetical protein